MAILYKNILDAFQPSKEITDPQRFSGRKKQLEHGAELLLTQDHIFIHGIRGIGKSSLALQLALIASGDTQLLKSIDSDLANEQFDYVTCFLTRDSSIKSINHLLYRLLIDQKALAQWNELLGLDEVGTYDFSPELNPRLVSDFWARVEKCASLATQGVAIFIDEFELIDNHDGFASLLKASPKNCVFIITGIGKTEKELVRDHQSISRQLDTGKLEVPSMSDEELRLVLDKAQKYISNEITFDTPATDALIKTVQGHPYLLHLVGKHSFLLAFKKKRNVVTLDDFQDALKEIALNRADRMLEDRYLKAIGNSPQREVVLRIFACGNPDSVHTSWAYHEAEIHKVGNPSYWVGDLQKDAYGAELEKVAEQYYKIRDPLFRAYISATPARLSFSTIDTNTSTIQHQNELVIVHLSDIHFGPCHYFTSLPISSDSVPEPDKPSLEKYLKESLFKAPHMGNLLVISGDITQSALTEEFEEAVASIKSIAECLVGNEAPESRVITVPGNHDVSWGILKTDPKARYLGFTPYIRFRRNFGKHIDGQVEPERLYEIHDFISEWNCVIVAFNSVVIEGPDDHRGYIGESQLKNAFEEVNALCAGKPVAKIAVFHHHLINVGSLETCFHKADEILSDAAFVKESLLNEGFCLALHGHRHFGHVEQVGNGESTLVVVGCGSTGATNIERGSQPLQYNRITLREVRGKVHVIIQVNRIVFDPARRAWLSSEDHKPQIFKVPYFIASGKS